MRLLIYGFGPYRRYQENVTEKVLLRIAKRRGLKKIVFPVAFDKSRFIGAVTEYGPEVILGLGQCSRGRYLRIESTAVNKRRIDKKERPRPIVPRGSRTLSTNLELDGGRQARASCDAGDYVCNYSMYVILDFLKRHRLPIRFGFLHIPRRYDPQKATRFLLKSIAEIETARGIGERIKARDKGK